MPPDPYALAAELAQPVARGYLSRSNAHASLLMAALDAERGGSPHDPLEVYHGLQHVLGLRLGRERCRRAVAEMRIRHRIKPLIALRKPSNTVLAEAHDVNGAEGFPFDEPEVTDIAVTEMYWALPSPQRSRRHA